MASKILNTRIQLKYDTEANWTSKNPVLLSGEMAISSDKNGQFKAGNGSSTWTQLSYNQVPWTSVTGRPSTLKNPTALTVQFNGVTNNIYDGSSAQTVNITPSAIGAAPTIGSISLSKLASTITLGNGDGATISQNAGTYCQKLEILDNATAGDGVFRFSQSSNSGASYTTLMEIRDDGNIVANKFTGSLSGRADTASKWATTRTLTLTGSVTGSVSIDGSGNMSLSTTTNHTHSYLPLSGGTLTGNVTFSNNTQGIVWNRVTDGASIKFNAETDATDNYMEFNVTDDENVNFKWTKTTGSTTIVLGTWKREGIRLSTGNFIGNLTGIATKATQDGSGNTITTKYVAVDTTQTISGAKTFSNIMTISNTTASTSKTTGALKVSGGVGVAGQMSANVVQIGDNVKLEYNSTLKSLDFIFA